MIQFIRLAAATTFVAGVLPAQGPAAHGKEIISGERRAVAINFRTVVGDQPFQCGERYPGLGSSKVEAWATEFRYFVSDVHLINAEGRAIPVDLEQDGLWQNGSIALLDFENGRGPCANGTPEERHEVRGTVPAGEYRGVRFIVGVPFERNHLELATQKSPLTLSRMFWSWTGGYKFMRVDIRAQRPDTSATAAFMIHLGSTGCTPGNSVPAPAYCSNGNRPEIILDEFDPDRHVIELDFARLVAGADLLTNTPQTAAGCMAAASDPDCGPVFAALGLSHPSAPPAPQQSAFRKVDR